MFGRHKPGSTDVWSEYLAERGAQGFDPEAVAAAAAKDATLGARAGEVTSGLRGAMGTPDQVREYFRRYEDYGVEQVILSSSAGNNRHEHICESLELFGREVLPEFLERDEQRRREKAERLAPAIDAALARKPPEDHPPLDPEYEIVAIPRADADRDNSEKFHRWLDEYASKIATGEDVSSRLAK